MFYRFLLKVLEYLTRSVFLCIVGYQVPWYAHILVYPIRSSYVVDYSFRCIDCLSVMFVCVFCLFSFPNWSFL
jgi:hypothetical protein